MMPFMEKKKKKKKPAYMLRLVKDLESLEKIYTDNMTVPNKKKMDILHFDIVPEKGLWKDYIFQLEIKLNEEWPHKRPDFRCLTKVWHPNIDLKGAVCLNILRDKYNPTLTISDFCIGFRFLFEEMPNTENPLNHEAADMMDDDMKKFEVTVKQYCRDHAKLSKKK